MYYCFHMEIDVDVGHVNYHSVDNKHSFDFDVKIFLCIFFTLPSRWIIILTFN